MIRMNPAHDTVNPPGQHNERALSEEIKLYLEEVRKLTELLTQKQQCCKCDTVCVKQQPLHNSEYSR